MVWVVERLSRARHVRRDRTLVYQRLYPDLGGREISWSFLDRSVTLYLYRLERTLLGGPPNLYHTLVYYLSSREGGWQGASSKSVVLVDVLWVFCLYLSFYLWGFGRPKDNEVLSTGESLLNGEPTGTWTKRVDGTSNRNGRRSPKAPQSRKLRERTRIQVHCTSFLSRLKILGGTVPFGE